MAAGKLITFEGIDGCGKTTQTRLLQERLQKEGVPHLLVREPGGTPLAEEIRKILLQKEHYLTLKGELLLYGAARAEIVEQVIGPALKDGLLVICDRYTDSTLAYQGYGAGLELTWIRSVNEWVTGGLCPHLTILLDLPLDTALQRRGAAGDRIEERDLSFYRSVRRGYLGLAGQEKERFRVIDAAASREEQSSFIWEQCKALLLEGEKNGYEL